MCVRKFYSHPTTYKNAYIVFLYTTKNLKKESILHK